jgi:hypothetical protein
VRINELQGINLKKGWDTDEDNILEEFYKPVLSRAVQYKRLAGFFHQRRLLLP